MTLPLVLALLSLLVVPSQRGAGTGVIAGTIVAAEDGKTPVRRVRVTVNAVDGSFGDTAITGDDGAFRFDGLRAGRYELRAMKPAYVYAYYGETRPARVGTPIALADGQSRTGIVFALTKGAVLGGVVLDAAGEPAAGSVTVFRRSPIGGRWIEAGEGSLDDRGSFRVFGLQPGEYRVAARARLDLFGTGSLEVPAADRASSPSTVGYAPVFFPGTTVESAAAAITLKPGEERTNLDFATQFVPMSRVTGNVIDPDGGDVRDAMLFMVSSAGVSMGGPHQGQGSAFQFDSVAPGDYLIGAALQAGKTDGKWASAKVSVTGGEVSGVVLTLRRGFTMTGRVVTEGTTAPGKTPPTFRVRALPGSDRLVVSGFQDPPRPDGSFTVHGLAPGRYQVLAHDESPQFEWRWSLKSIVINGANVAHLPIEIDGDVRDVVVTFTDRVTELSGTLQDASGRAASDYHIVIFPAERQAWLPESARLRTTRPGTDGTYVVRGLPAGEYLVAALTDVEQNEWREPAFLEQLIAGAVRVTLAEGERRTQGIRIAK